MSRLERKPHVAIIGAGPAGLTAAYLLSKEGIPVTVLEADPTYVGGISRTVKYKGFCFDIGGHRFFSKSQEVESLWAEILPNDMLERRRSSRIFYRKKFYSYPLKVVEALKNLGILEAIHCGLSYLSARLFPSKQCRSFEDWVSREFGYRLFSIFFKTYTEKVWGTSCKEISADWAAQRIKGLSLWSAVRHAIWPKKAPKGKNVIKTLIETFRYPRKGPGMMWETCAAQVQKMGGEILTGQKASTFTWNHESQKWTIGYRSNVRDEDRVMIADHVISSVPIRELVNALKPPLSENTVKAANSLKYRDFITVVLIAKDCDLFEDNWIYIHDPAVKVGRIQNFKSWSPEMVPDPSYNCYGLEYFCFDGDGLWNQSDNQLIELAKKEMGYIGLVRSETVVDACVVRQLKAYPVYDHEYATHVDAIRSELESKFPSLHLVGRNGMHKYNNQDHAMMTAMLTVKNILADKKIYDVWRVNQDAEYHESGASGVRTVPIPMPEAKDPKKSQKNVA